MDKQLKANAADEQVQEQEEEAEKQVAAGEPAKEDVSVNSLESFHPRAHKPSP